MVKKIFQCGYISYMTDANRVAYILKHIPFVGRKIHSDSARAFGIIGIACRIIWEIIKKAVFVAAAMLGPMYVLSRLSVTGNIGYGLENSFVYFSMVMICFCGSVNNSVIFETGEEAYVMLREVRCNPADYFRMVILRKNITEFISFWLVFSVFGMNVAKALYLTIVIVGSRYAGEAFNIMMFKATAKPFSMHRKGNIAVMLLSLFVAYFIPYLRGYVPGAYDLVFNTIWLMVILLMIAVFIYYVWNYSGYPKAAARLFKKSSLDDGAEDDAAVLEEEPAFMAEDVSECNAQAYSEINREFFKRNKSGIASNIRFKIALSIIALAAALIASFNGHAEEVSKIISYSMPVMVFVMCVFSNSMSICRSFFYQCDCELLKKEGYNNRNDILENYFIRLRYMLIIDIVPAAVLTVVYAVAGIVSKSNAGTVIPVCVGILMLSCLFTVLQLTLYYAIQPYTKDAVKSRNRYVIINIIMYVCSSLFIYINSTALFFTLGVGLALAVVMAAGVSLVGQIGYRTFRLK